MTISTERYNELAEVFADATLDNAQDCLEWLVHIQDFCGLDESLDTVLARLEAHTGQQLIVPHKPEGDLKPYARIFALFAKAKESGLDWPKITLGGDLNVTLSMNAKGIINVTNGERYGTPSNVWYGRILPANGTCDPTLDLRGNLPASDNGAVQQMLINFDTDPAKTATLYGHKTGACMFCARKLTDPQSVIVGYGPSCAAHYGLPHGDVKQSYIRAENKLAIKKILETK